MPGFLDVVPVFAALLAAAPLLAMELYVGPGGDDSGPGTREQPLATLTGARDAIRQIKADGGLPAGGMTVWIAGGTYELTETFALTAQDSGTAEAPIVYRVADGQEVRLIGGKRIEGFTPVSDAAMPKRLPEAAREHVVMADLRAQGITNYGRFHPRGFAQPEKPAPLELFFDGRPMTLAGWPDDGWQEIADVPEVEPIVDNSGVERGKDVDRFIYSGDRPPRWDSAPDVWLHGYWTYPWADSYVHVKSINPQERAIVTHEPHGVYGYTSGGRWRAINLLEELDTPGEYYVDRDAGLLYFWPPERLNAGQCQVSLLESPMVTLTDVSHVTLRGLVLEVSRGDAIRITEGAATTVAGCTIRNIGQSAVTIDGGERHRVVSCDIYDVGEAGVKMIGGNRQTLTSANHEAVNNHVHHYARWCRTYRGAIHMVGVGHRAAHNLIHDAPHSAIFFNGNDHLIEFNRVYRVTQETGDAGVFYTGRDWTTRGHVIRYNFIHHTPSRMQHGTNAVYLDDCACGTTVFGNIFVDAGRAVMIGGGRDNTIENNIFINCQAAVHVDARGQTWARSRIEGREGSWSLYGKLEAVPYDQPPYSTRYPGLAEILEDEPLAPNGNVIARNIKVGRGDWLELQSVTDDQLQLEGNLVDRYPHFLRGDPLRAKFQLKAESPAIELGFRPIPFDQIGLQEDEYRRDVPAVDWPGWTR